MKLKVEMTMYTRDAAVVLLIEYTTIKRIFKMRLQETQHVDNPTLDEGAESGASLQQYDYWVE
jgi:hypothetical protein